MNEVCLSEGKGKAFLYSILAGLSSQGLKRRYVRVAHGVGKTKPLDGHLSPIRERPGSPLNAQKPSRATLFFLWFFFFYVGEREG